MVGLGRWPWDSKGTRIGSGSENEQHPSNVHQNFVKYENMPEGAEQRAGAGRNAWIGRQFGDVAQTFSKLVVTEADITSLLRAVEADQSLVHAAYYTDDECIARIADWIAGKSSTPSPSVDFGRRRRAVRAVTVLYYMGRGGL